MNEHKKIKVTLMENDKLNSFNFQVRRSSSKTMILNEAKAIVKYMSRRGCLRGKILYCEII